MTEIEKLRLIRKIEKFCDEEDLDTKTATVDELLDALDEDEE